MRCERCGTDGHVERHQVDEFTGLLCEDCREAWEQFTMTV